MPVIFCAWSNIFLHATALLEWHVHGQVYIATILTKIAFSPGRVTVTFYRADHSETSTSSTGLLPLPIIKGFQKPV